MMPSSLHEQITDYLAMRRGLGFQLAETGWWLTEFARHIEQLDHQGPTLLLLVRVGCEVSAWW